MPDDRRRQAIRSLLAAYPTAGATPDTQRVYEQTLADVDDDELEDAIVSLVATVPRLPAISDVRATVAERRLGLPSALEAWERVSRYAALRAGYQGCSDCDGLGGADLVLCKSCNGTGEREVVRTRFRAETPPVVLRALDVVGGASALRDTDRPDVVRAQFLKAYEQLRQGAVAAANLASAGLPPREQRQIEAA